MWYWRRAGDLGWLKMHSMSSRARSLICRIALATVLACGLADAARAQDLSKKLDTLNIRLATEHYALAGTVSDRTLRAYGDLLEFIHREYAVGFASLLQEDAGANKAQPGRPAKAKVAKTKAAGKAKRAGRDQPSAPSEAATTQPAADPNAGDGRFRVLVFATESDYQEFGRAHLGGGTAFTGGMFLPGADALLILDRGNPDDTMQTLFHEAFHQFMHRYVKNPPMWLNEGLATYYGDMRVERGRLVFRPDADRWKLVRKLIEKEQAIPLSEVVAASRAEFYDDTPIKVRGFENVRRKSAFYAEAYTLIHLLLADATARPRLQDYIRALAQDDGKHVQKITDEFFGPDVCAHMQGFWVNHVNSRPEQN